MRETGKWSRWSWTRPNQAESVGFSQHNNGVSAAWSDADKSGDSVISYVAKGSHANYLRSFQGKLGFAQDVVDSGGTKADRERLPTGQTG